METKLEEQTKYIPTKTRDTKDIIHVTILKLKKRIIISLN